MKLFPDFLRRLWPENEPVSTRQQALLGDQLDQSSMAEFVRILQEEERRTRSRDA